MIRLACFWIMRFLAFRLNTRTRKSIEDAKGSEIGKRRKGKEVSSCND